MTLTVKEMLEINLRAIDAKWAMCKITVMSRKGNYETVICTKEDYPEFIECFLKQWAYFNVENIPVYDWKTLEAQRQKERQDMILASQISTGSKHSAAKNGVKNSILSKKKLTINITNWTQCTCAETGISFKVELNGITPNSLPVIHPFAFLENVEESAKKASKSGILLENQWDENILAGMLITILNQNDLLLCKNPIDANKYLCKAEKRKLAFTIRWFLARRSFHNFPKLSLLDLHLHHNWYKPESQKSIPDAEIVLENYLKACQGEKFSGSNYISIPERKRTMRVFTDKVKQEAKEYLEAQAEAKHLFVLIENEFGGLSIAKPLLAKIKTAIIALSFLSESNKQKIASQIVSTFSDFEPAAELAMIFRKVSTQAIQDDLLTFTQEQAQSQNTANDGKIQKVDFMSLLKTGKKD